MQQYYKRYREFHFGRYFDYMAPSRKKSDRNKDALAASD